MYAQKNAAATVNSSRYKIFLKNYKVTNVDEPFTKKSLKNCDASSLPPCQTELHQHTLRAQHISTIWKNAHLKVPTNSQPSECGWVESNDEYEFKWFDGPQFPPSVRDVLLSEELDKDEDLVREYSDEDSDIEYDSEEDNESKTSCDSERE
ncbi:hypothetical protein QAD02_021125 [Eretmocerus hayati]|uniref:Uncharacterized protein n=1 Tax=Eretmocerus hayati TaxID=131215 RepID=A0ACC2PSJ6_9HYME|nr:hypothetical protein QAD02_021125 [Eretmocerus hayati]